MIRGFLYTFPDGIVQDKLHEQLIAILSKALDYVSKLGGKMVIAFPDSTPAEVSVITKQLAS